MKTMAEIALEESAAEIRAACRRPIDEAALETMLGWVRPNFERLLNRLDGGRRWADLGERMRDNGRHLGALADFFASHNDSPTVGLAELSHAIGMMRADCTTRAQRVPQAYTLCNAIPIQTDAAEMFLQSLAPAPELVRRAS